MPQSLWSIRRLVTLEGALSSLLEQDRTSTGNPYKNGDGHFTTETAAKKYQLQMAILCAVFYKSRERDSFFPVEVIYTHFLCHCHWEWCSLHNITAAVFGDSPLPKLGNLTSQNEDDRALCAKPAISQGVK